MRTRFAVFLLALILAGVFWQWWMPGPRVATDSSLISSSALKSQLNFPQTWSVKGTEGLGEYTVFTLWSWPFNLLQGILANLNLSFSLLERILIIIPFLLLGGFGIWKICRRLNLSPYAKFTSVLFYLTNTYILLVIDGGQLTISLAYALFPLAFLFLEDAIEGKFKKKILAGLLISAIGFFDIRFLYIFVLLGLIKFFFEFNLITAWLKTIFVILLVILGINAFWLLTLTKFPISSNTYSSLIQTSLTSFITFPHALLMLSPHWLKNVFGVVTPLRFEFIIFPILAFLAPILKTKNKNVGFWLVVALISLFLTKGSSEPFGYAYVWLYKNIPGFSLFRDSSKFFFLVALAYSILIGISLDEILRRIKNYKIKTSFFVILVGFLVFITRPVWLGQMTGTFSQPAFQKEYSEINKFFANDQKQSNIFWIPTISPLTVLDSRHPAVEASRLAQKRPFKQAIRGTYETFNFLREASYMGQLFDVANIGYIAYPPLDPRRETDSDKMQYYHTFLNQLSNLPWLERIDNSTVPLLRVKQHQDLFFITSDIWWVIGSDNIYNEATKSAELKFSKNALIFAEEYPGISKRLDELSDVKIVLNNKTDLDLAASFIEPSNLIFPAKNLNFDPDKYGWWKKEATDLVGWRAFLQTKYGIDNLDFDLGGSWAVGEGSLNLKVKSEKFKANHILLARVLESTRSGELDFHQEGQLIGTINTRKGENNVRWFEVGQLLKDSKELEIGSLGDINVVNALAVLDKNEWRSYLDKSRKLQEKIINFDEKNLPDNDNPTVTYQKINLTKYMVDVSNLTKSSFLVFSQNYDNHWKMSKLLPSEVNGQTPLPVYSLLNGFYVMENGQYIIEFEPQKYVYPGLIISGITLVSLLLLLI